MKRHMLPRPRAAFTLLLLTAMTTIGALAATEQVVHIFSAFGHGGNPQASLIADAAGNLYGTASTGGSVNGGVAFKLTLTIGGRWQQTILHDFKGGSDGCQPLSGLAFDNKGNLYGTTVGFSSYGCTGSGIVFELSPNSDGHWTETIIHTFAAYPDGGNPQGNLVFDSSGNLYGTTAWGGSDSNCTCGTVFELSPAQHGGGWSERILYSFTGAGDGGIPVAGVSFDAAGNLYGTTSAFADPYCGLGMYAGCGTVFKLTHSSDGEWSESTLYRFNNSDGANPSSALVFDAAGNLYGTTQYGGLNGNGVVFELTPSSSGAWTEKVLWSPFNLFNPLSGLVLDGNGNLYGTASGSITGIYCGGLGCGSVFELSPSSSGDWLASVVYNFVGNLDGDYPAAGLIFDTAGNLYGTTEAGGGSNCLWTPPGANSTGCGTVFKLTQSSSGKWFETQLYSFPGTDGIGPSGLTSDGAGNLYGTTGAGGAYGFGEVFKLIPSNNSWDLTTLYSFTGGRDGANPSGVILDAEGNLYGTAALGGNALGCGVVFKLTLGAHDLWKQTVLHLFPGGASADGCVPLGNLVFDAFGNLYGATNYGGGAACSPNGINGCGTIFKLAPTGSGKWSETILHSFPASSTDGIYPPGGLVIDTSGNIFGTTSGLYNCTSFCGTVFQLSRNPIGAWSENVLYTFPATGNIGNLPNGSLTLDAAGNIYGTTAIGGQTTYFAWGCGAAYELSPSSAVWTATVLHTFTGASDGCFPNALTLDASGNLYGTASWGGSSTGFSGAGTVFELSPSSGSWTENVLHTFTGAADGAGPDVSLVLDGSGSLYGMTRAGGGPLGQGVVFQTKP